METNISLYLFNNKYFVLCKYENKNNKQKIVITTFKPNDKPNVIIK